jgi:hypothetical protein
MPGGSAGNRSAVGACRGGRLAARTRFVRGAFTAASPFERGGKMPYLTMLEYPAVHGVDGCTSTTFAR